MQRVILELYGKPADEELAAKLLEIALRENSATADVHAQNLGEPAA